MSFLKKIGQDIARFLGMALGFAPVVNQYLPASAQGTATRVEGDLTQIAGVVQMIEAGFAAISDPNAKTGAQKLNAAAPSVAQIVHAWLASGALGSRKVKDQAMFQKGTTDLTGAMAEILNSLE